MADKFPVDRFRENFVSHYHEASPAELAAGRSWYPDAHAKVATWATFAERSERNVAALVAVLSPQCPWDRNLQIAEDILCNGYSNTFGALPVNVLKAERVLAENVENTRDVMPTGRKVENFARNLSGDYNAVTVDTHMVQAAWNDVTVPAGPYFKRPIAYDAIANAVRLCADEVGETPAAFQAIVWTVWKRLHASGVKRHVLRLHGVKVARLAKRRKQYAARVALKVAA